MINTAQQPASLKHGWLTTRGGIAKAIIALAVAFACALPGAMLSYDALQEPWTLFRIARANLSIQEGTVATFTNAATGYRSERIGGEMLQIGLLEATQWAREALGIVPIGSLILCVIYYALARTVTRSRWSAIGITLYSSYFYPLANSQFSTQTYVWSHALFLCFLLVLWHWAHTRTTRSSLLILILFGASFLHYHTTPIWMIASLATVVGSDVVLGRRMRNWPLVALCIVIYCTFDTVVYGNGLVRIAAEATSDSFAQSFVNRILAPLFGERPAALGAFEVAPINGRSATWSTLFVLVLLAAPPACWCCWKVCRAVWRRSGALLAERPHDVFVWAVIAAAVVHSTMYAFYGSTSTRVVQVAFPFILPLVLRDMRFGLRLEKLAALSIALAAAIGFVGFSATLERPVSSADTGVAAKLLPAHSAIVADAALYGSLLISASDDHKLLDFNWLTSQIYGALVGQGAIEAGLFDYAVVDASNKPMISSNWVFFQPWSAYIDRIERNRGLDKLYDSERIQIFGPAGSALPAYQPAPADVVAPSANGLGGALRLALAVLALLFVPGLIVAGLVARSFQRAPEHRSATLALAIGLSIALVTAVGYGVNFSPLTLSWFLPALGLLLCVGAAGVCWAQRASLHQYARWLPYAGAFAAGLLLWALLATSVADARTAQSATFSEFFVTRRAAQADTLVVSVINRLGQRQQYSVALSVDGRVVGATPAQVVERQGLWSTEWHIPASPGEQRVTFTLSQQGVASHTLFLTHAGEQ